MKKKRMYHMPSLEFYQTQNDVIMTSAKSQWFKDTTIDDDQII